MNGEWSDDDELFNLMKRELFSAVVGDVMDVNHLLHQFLPQSIKPIRDDMILAGRAMTVLEADVFATSVKGSSNQLMEEPFGLMFRALDDLQTNEVYICSGGSHRYAMWGEMMSTRASKLGASGAVVNGCYRDSNAILNLNFPTFGVGSYAQDQGARGKVIDFRIPIEFGNVAIQSGDIIFGDRDGVCVIPKQAEVEVIHAALEKVRGEKLVKKALDAGMSATDAWHEFGIM